MDRGRTIKNVLNNLSKVNNERIHAYEKALHQADDRDLRILFMGMIDQGRKIRNELGVEIQSRGMAMQDGCEKISLWKRVGKMFAPQGEENILKQCCRAEAGVQEVYDEALSNDIPSYLRDLFNAQRALLKSSWQEMLSFRKTN